MILFYMSLSAALLVLALGVFVMFHHTKSLENDLLNRMHIMTDDIIEHQLYLKSPEELKVFFMSNESYHKDSYGNYINEISFQYAKEMPTIVANLSVAKELPNKKYLIVSSTSEYIDVQVEALLLKLILALLITLSLIMFGLHLLLKKLLNPLKCLVNYCNNASVQKQKLPVCQGSFEVNSLKSAILGLEQSNNILCKEKQDIFKEAAHEIKTPIAILKARLALFEKSDMPKREFIHESVNDISTISNKLRELIFLKAIEWDIQRAKEFVAMQTQCTMMQQLFKPILEKKHIEMISNLQEDFSLYIHKEAIGRVMQAIFENIFMHTKNGTTIRTFVDSKKHELKIINEIGHESDEILFSSHIGSKLIERLAEKLDYSYSTEEIDGFFYTTIIFKAQNIS
jgi:signal transduction histidine kinase